MMKPMLLKLKSIDLVEADALKRLKIQNKMLHSLIGL